MINLSMVNRWVPNTDTLHALIREFRDARKIPLNMEHRMMLGMAPDYDHLMVMQKVEVFEHALEGTAGDDLHKVRMSCNVLCMTLCNVLCFLVLALCFCLYACVCTL